tara:strand:- start:20 stop:232 length:213 start_codon:yes stop_codon:yes gene_type:complete
MDVCLLSLRSGCLNLYLYLSIDDGYGLRTAPLGIQGITEIQMVGSGISVFSPISPENTEIHQENIYLILE